MRTMRAEPTAGRGRVCPFCAARYRGSPEHCPSCGATLGKAHPGLRRAAVAAERERSFSRKAVADGLFLGGLILGGPMISFTGHVVLGAFIVLAAGIASVLRRYTPWSLPGILVVGIASAMAIAAWVIDPARGAVEESRAGEAARLAFAKGLDDPEQDVYVEARGLGTISIWFSVPEAQAVPCGEYPPPEVRRHLAELGFARVVVETRNRSGGICSFPP